MKKIAVSCSLLILSMMAGCSQANGDDGYTAGNLSGINHMADSGVNSFSVNGYGGTLTGNSCCIMLPEKWTPDLKARVEWETDPEPYAHLPPLGTNEYRKAYSLHKANYRQHSTIADIPQYGKERCGLTVHFLPCNQVKVTTACSGYGTENYPINEPLNMKEPAACPVN